MTALKLLQSLMMVIWQTFSPIIPTFISFYPINNVVYSQAIEKTVRDKCKIIYETENYYVNFIKCYYKKQNQSCKPSVDMLKYFNGYKGFCCKQIVDNNFIYILMKNYDIIIFNKINHS